MREVESEIKYWVQPSARKKALDKKQRNKCVRIGKKSIKDIWIKSQKKESKLMSMSSQISMKFERHLTNTTNTNVLSKKVAKQTL